RVAALVGDLHALERREHFLTFLTNVILVDDALVIALDADADVRIAAPVAFALRRKGEIVDPTARQSDLLAARLQAEPAMDHKATVGRADTVSQRNHDVLAGVIADPQIEGRRLALLPAQLGIRRSCKTQCKRNARDRQSELQASHGGHSFVTVADFQNDMVLS